MNHPRTRHVARISRDGPKDEIRIDLDAFHGSPFVMLTARAPGGSDEPWARVRGELAIRRTELKAVITGLQQALDELEN